MSAQKMLLFFHIESVDGFTSRIFHGKTLAHLQRESCENVNKIKVVKVSAVLERNARKMRKMLKDNEMEKNSVMKYLPT